MIIAKQFLKNNIPLLLIFLLNCSFNTGTLNKIYEKEAYMLYEVCFNENFDCCHYNSVFKFPVFVEFTGNSKRNILESYKKGVYTIPIEIPDSLKGIVNMKLFDFDVKIDSLVSLSNKIVVKNNKLSNKMSRNGITFSGFKYTLLKMKFKYIEMGTKSLVLPDFNYKKHNKEQLLKKNNLKVNYIVSIDEISLANADL